MTTKTVLVLCLFKSAKYLNLLRLLKIKDITLLKQPSNPTKPTEEEREDIFEIALYQYEEEKLEWYWKERVTLEGAIIATTDGLH